MNVLLQSSFTVLSCLPRPVFSFAAGSKRRHSDDDDSDVAELAPVEGHVTTMAQMQEVYGEFATSLTERVKRRRCHKTSIVDDDDSDSDDGRHNATSILADDSTNHSSSNNADCLYLPNVANHRAVVFGVNEFKRLAEQVAHHRRVV